MEEAAPSVGTTLHTWHPAQIPQDNLNEDNRTQVDDHPKAAQPCSVSLLPCGGPAALALHTHSAGGRIAPKSSLTTTSNPLTPGAFLSPVDGWTSVDGILWHGFGGWIWAGETKKSGTSQEELHFPAEIIHGSGGMWVAAPVW